MKLLKKIIIFGSGIFAGSVLLISSISALVGGQVFAAIITAFLGLFIFGIFWAKYTMDERIGEMPKMQKYVVNALVFLVIVWVLISPFAVLIFL